MRGSVGEGAVTLELVVPRGWHRVPESDSEIQGWIASVTAKGDAETRERLAVDLARLAAISLGDPRSTRTHFVFVRAAGSTTSEAHLTIDYYSAGPGSFDAYSSAAVASAETPRASAVYAQRASVGELADQPAVVVQDFIIEGAESQSGDLQERYLAAIFPRALDLLIELQLTSPDLALFGDIVDYGNGIASSLSWKVRTG